MADPFADLIPNNAAAQQVDPFADLVPQQSSNNQSAIDKRLARAEGQQSIGSAVLSGASSLAGLVTSGFTGTAGALAGLFPGGETGSEKANRFLEGTQEAFRIEPQGERAKQLLQNVGGAGEAITRGIREPFAAAASVSLEEEQPLTPDEQVAVRERVRNEGIGKVLGDAGFESTGSPAFATALEVLPTAIASSIGVKNPFRGTPKTAPIPKPSRPTVTNQPGASVGKPSLDRPVDITPIKLTEQPSAESIISNLQRGNAAKVAEEVFPDVNIIESAQRLGVDLNPEHYSTNVAFQGVARALKSQPASTLQVNEVRALNDIANRADDLVKDLGGSLDKASVSESIRLELTTKIDELSSVARKGYKQVRETIPVATRVNTDPLRGFLDTKLAELGGNKALLSAPEKALLKLLGTSKKPRTVTYAGLDRLRKEVGRGFQRQGVFADADSAILSEVYGALSDTQGGVARAFGVRDIYDNARKSVAIRKGIEDQSIELFGRSLSNSLVPKIQSAATGLAKGDVANFNKLMNAVPKGRRAELAATVLGDIFAGGSRRGGRLGQGFVSTFESLSRNPTAKNVLLSRLSTEGRQVFNDIGRVFTGIVRSNAKPLANPSGSAAGIIKALEEGTALLRIYDVVKKVGKAELASSAIGATGIGSATAIGAIVGKGRAPIAVSADALLTSPAFTKSINKAIQGDVKTANKIIENSPQFKTWQKGLNSQSAAQLAKIGFIDWLTLQDQN